MGHQLPASRKINCPACGFSISATAKTCDFCGYELNASLTGSDNEQAHVTETEKSTSKRNGQSDQIRAASGRRNGEREKAQAPKAETAAGESNVATVRPSGNASAAPEIDPEKRIRELEAQLSEAEKELDVISKILAEGSTSAAQSKPVAESKGVTAPAVTMGNPNLPEPVRRGKIDAEREAGKLAGAPPAGDEEKSGMAGLRFTAKAKALLPIIAGAVIYGISFAFPAQLGSTEQYFLAVTGSVLVATGIFASIEPVGTSQGRTPA